MSKEHIASWSYAEVWDKFPVPARPTQKELSLIEEELKKRTRNEQEIRVLILGSTIEYRSLTKKYKVKPVVVDFSKENFDSLTSYSKEIFDNEEFIELDWLKISHENEFDLILGHRVFNVISHNQIENMFQIMKKALKPGGIYFCKGNVRFSKDTTSLDELREKWAFSEREHPLCTYLEVKLYFECSDENGYLNYSRARKIINNWHSKNLLSQEDYDLMRIVLSMGDDARFYSAKEETIKETLEKMNFENKWIILDEDYAKNMPIIILRK